MPYPMMGWNAWYLIPGPPASPWPNQTTLLEIADAFVSSGLAAAGYVYMSPGVQTLASHTPPKLAHPENFPGGLRAFRDQLHARRLKFTWGVSPGLAWCESPYSPPEGCLWDVAAKWVGEMGADNLVADWDIYSTRGQDQFQVGAANITFVRERYRSIWSSMMKYAGPNLTYQLYDGAVVARPWLWAHEVSHTWLTSGEDISCSWDGIVDMVDNVLSIRNFDRHVGPGSFPDLGGILVGHNCTCFTQQFLFRSCRFYLLTTTCGHRHWRG